MMRLLVDQDKCVGCGLCEENLPEVLEMGRFAARVIVGRVPDALIDATITMVEDCPAEALSVTAEDTETVI